MVLADVIKAKEIIEKPAQCERLKRAIDEEVGRMRKVKHHYPTQDWMQDYIDILRKDLPKPR